jgi:hypothetical protein
MQVQQDFIIIVHQVLAHLIHMFSHPKHTSHLTLSLGGKVDSRSYLASTAKAVSNTKTRGKVERTPLSNQVKHRS